MATLQIPDGWNLEAETGGGCSAWSRPIPKTDKVAWMTDVDDPSIPTSPDSVRCAFMDGSDNFLWNAITESWHLDEEMSGTVMSLTEAVNLVNEICNLEEDN